MFFWPKTKCFSLDTKFHLKQKNFEKVRLGTKSHLKQTIFDFLDQICPKRSVLIL